MRCQTCKTKVVHQIFSPFVNAICPLQLKAVVCLAVVLWKCSSFLWGQEKLSARPPTVRLGLLSCALLWSCATALWQPSARMASSFAAQSWKVGEPGLKCNLLCTPTHICVCCTCSCSCSCCQTLPCANADHSCLSAKFVIRQAASADVLALWRLCSLALQHKH